MQTKFSSGCRNLSLSEGHQCINHNSFSHFKLDEEQPKKLHILVSLHTYNSKPVLFSGVKERHYFINLSNCFSFKMRMEGLFSSKSSFKKLPASQFLKLLRFLKMIRITFETRIFSQVVILRHTYSIRIAFSLSVKIVHGDNLRELYRVLLYTPKGFHQGKKSFFCRSVKVSVG